MSDPAAPQTWTIATDDTQITLGLVGGKLCLTDFRNPLAAWNWAQKADQKPAVVTFLATTGGPKPEPLTWVFREVLTATGQVTFVFTCASPALELRSQWLAQPGRGPVRHVMTIRNQDNHPVAVDAQPSLDLTLHPPEPAIPGLCWWYVNDEGALWGDSPDVAQAPGYYQEPVVAGATREILASSGYDFIPIAICDAGSSHGIYYAVEWSHSFLRFGGLPGSQIRLEADNRPGEPGGLVYDFRTCAMGAFQWFFDNPVPTNGGIPWTDDERRAIAREVQTYKTRLRPLIRTAQLYHILPRPDDRNWDGIQYYDPTNGKGVAYIFKPQSDQDRQTIRLKGLEAQHTYILDFEDGSNPSITLTGQQLMSTGFAMALPGIFVSELVWIRRA